MVENKKDRKIKWSVIVWWFGLLGFGLIMAWNNSLTVSSDLARNQIEFEFWQPYCWEYSSFLASYVLYFAVAWLAIKRPLNNNRLLTNLSIHLPASVVFSICHVALMVNLRKLIYFLADSHYDFGNWPTELFYEYRKDVITYFVFVLAVSIFQFIKKHRTTAVQRTVEKLKIKNKQGVRWLDYKDISTIESGGNYVYIHAKEQVMPMRATMADIEQHLDKNRFIRVHRSYIINKREIKSLSNQGKDPCLLTLNNDKQVPVSRKYRDQVFQLVKHIC